MKSKRILLLLAVFFFCITAGLAQTKAKTPAKKKKAAPKAISVYVCTDNKDKTFHKRRSCGGLNKCSNEIKFITSAADLKKWKRKSCTRCNN